MGFKNKKWLVIMGLICLGGGQIIYAQDLDKIGKKDMVTVNGGINLSSIFLKTNNPLSTRSPFSWYATGNVSIGLLGWSLPFAYSISNQSKTFSQPFNQVGVTPTYKWVKLYAGWNSISLSPYSLSGNPFLGGGVELSPKNWKFLAFYGLFRKAIAYDFVEESDALMSYRRMGFGGKVGYENKGYALELSVFKAQDDVKSLTYIPEKSLLTPQEGAVISVHGKMPITKFFQYEMEYALSGLTRNIFSEQQTGITPPSYFPSFLLNNKGGSDYHAAYKTSLTFNQKIISVSANYERIDPNYLTLGAFYFNNDFENITLAPSVRLLKGKLNVGLNAGQQRNNLGDAKLSTNKRWIGSANMSYVPNTHWTFNSSYSNFTNFTRNRPNTDPFYVVTPADTMRFYQVSQTFNGTTNYNFSKTKDYKHSFSLNGNHVNSAQTMGKVILPSTKSYNGSFSYGLSFVPKKLTLAVSVNGNQTETKNLVAQFFGPGITVNKVFLNNTLTTSAASMLNTSIVNKINTGLVFSERLSMTYAPKLKVTKYGKPNFGLSVNYVNKPKAVSTAIGLSEFTGNVNVGYGF
jgi:hypothetical protein